MAFAKSMALETKEKRKRIHPQKFALWVACASMIMFFAAFTSGYIVRRGAGNWLEFVMPNLFFYNTIVILLSSLTLHGAYTAFKKMNTKVFKTLLGASLILGIAFLVLQYQAWIALTENGIELTTNPSSSFLFVISGFHAAHVLGGVAAIAIAFVKALVTKHEVTPIRQLRLELTMQYWHFVDILWLYLFVFLIVQQ
jgi:cytochrome c oxidase subunit 3